MTTICVTVTTCFPFHPDPRYLLIVNPVWSNFEIADMDFWRGPAYTAYFNHLEANGGFYYERWGDAPVHSIAAALFLPQREIHFFEEIGYDIRHLTILLPLNPVIATLTVTSIIVLKMTYGREGNVAVGHQGALVSAVLGIPAVVNG
jgi:hypothetical protein